MKLKSVVLKRRTLIPGLGTVEFTTGQGEVIGPWVAVQTPTGRALLWGADIGPSEIDDDAVPEREAAPARGRNRPASPAE